LHQKSQIWLSSSHFTGEEQKYISLAFQENKVASTGSNIDSFEEDLERFLGTDVRVSALSSGTAALHLALVQCGVQAGDEVICQSMTFSASANPIVYQGAVPIFVDSEPETWNICPHSLEDAIVDRIAKGKKPKAVIAVLLYGMPFQVDEVLAVCEKYDIPLIEDAAESLGSTYKGKACGSFGKFGVLSFNGNKIITTSGGGALVSHSQSEKNQTIFLSTQARDDAPHYQHSQIGYNYRMNNVSAGIGRGQMEVLPQRIIARRKMHTFYKEIFKEIEGITLLEEPNADFYSNHWLSAILIDETKTGFNSEKLRLFLAKENIETRPLWKPMHLQPVFSDAPYYGKVVSEALFTNGLCLPSGSNLTDIDRERLSKIFLNNFFTL